MRYLVEIGGYLGMFLLQGATLPATFEVLLGNSSNTPPVAMILMIWTGLILYLVRSLVQKDLLYTISNGIGVFLNTVLLYCLIFVK